MRVCIVSQEYPPGPPMGGIGSQTHAKARGLAMLGHDVDVLTIGDEDGPPLRSGVEDGLRVHRLRPPGHDPVVHRPQTYWLGYTWAVLGALRALGDRTVYDVVDFPDYGAEGLAFQADRTEGEPAVVVHLHGSLTMFVEQIGWPDRDSDFARIGTPMERFCIERADRVAASSAAIADFAAAAHGIAREDIDVVHAGVDAAVFVPPADDPVQRRVLFVGNVALNKGVRTVFEAVMRLRADHPDLALTIVGPGEDDLGDELAADAARVGAGDAVELLGYVQPAALPELYRAATIVAAPSQYEGGVGMVNLEAMACARPVVASPAGGSAEAVVDGETGLLVAPGDVDATIAALDRLLRDGALRRRLGHNARRAVEQWFGLEPYATRVLASYERARERRAAGVAS